MKSTYTMYIKQKATGKSGLLEEPLHVKKKKRTELAVGVQNVAADKLQDLVDKNNRETPHTHKNPVVVCERHEREDISEKRDVKDQKVHSHGSSDGQQEIGVAPRRHLEERRVFRESVQGVEHLDQDKNSQREGRGVLFALQEVVAGVFESHAVNVSDFSEVFPNSFFGIAMPPVSKLRPLDECMPISSPVVEDIPVGEDTHSSDANVNTNNHVTEEHPTID